jgi:hypothetical protein
LQLRGEFYDTFNHPNFKNANTNIGDANYGKITTTMAPASSKSRYASSVLVENLEFSQYPKDWPPNRRPATFRQAYRRRDRAGVASNYRNLFLMQVAVE